MRYNTNTTIRVSMHVSRMKLKVCHVSGAVGISCRTEFLAYFKKAVSVFLFADQTNQTLLTKVHRGSVLTALFKIPQTKRFFF